MQLPRPIDTLTCIALGASVYDLVVLEHGFFSDLGEVWTINAGARLFRHDVVWDMHTPEWIASKPDRNTNDRITKRREWLRTHDKPIVMPRADPEFPTSITYPLKTVVETTQSVYFATGTAYMLAMAYCCEVKTLKLYGFDFSYDRNSNTHDEQGRACAEYWVGRLSQKGVRIEVTNNTHFLDMKARSKGKIYGYHEPVEFEFPNSGGKGRFIGPDYL